MQQNQSPIPINKKDPIPSIAYLKLQLPSIFDIKDDIQVQMVGYRFDPIKRLSSTKQTLRLNQENIGQVITKIKQEVTASLNFYQQRNLKNIQRQIQPFAFQLQILVRVTKINNPSFQVKPLIKRNSLSFDVIEINLNEENKESLTAKVKASTEKVLSALKNHSLSADIGLISFAPQKIFNPHLFIKTQTKQKYIEYYTKGLYEYYHYGDQSFNDHGWGCAYRSLQTLLSWLSIQNHLALPKMLTIPQIQELIDRINLGSTDKLRNSKEWIGATEVSWVVKHLTNYDCRILHISDGKKIIQECQMFRQHFEKVGSPIMYGGGQYAYSIVGLNYSWKLGECEFLILDPHYAGPDSLDKIIQKKGLCWRKPEEMFKKGVFYNFCLPII